MSAYVFSLELNEVDRMLRCEKGFRKPVNIYLGLAGMQKTKAGDGLRAEFVNARMSFTVCSNLSATIHRIYDRRWGGVHE
jgi:hypothetical protein